VTAKVVRFAPSMLTADFTRHGYRVAEAEHAGVERIQVEVMNRHFVPNLSMRPRIISSLRRP
jgi:ribulose-phosphate 3-epimerase